MPSIQLAETETDDPAFVELASHCIAHYADLYRVGVVTVIHIDNWFGDRWLGFAGKYMGIAGIRNRSLHTSLPMPPFRPSRVLSAFQFIRKDNGSYVGSQYDFSMIHVEKNGGIIWELIRPGLYCWYSGNTKANMTASLMIYEVTRDGNDAWYVNFQKGDRWEFHSCRNISPEECLRIIEGHRRASDSLQL